MNTVSFEFEHEIGDKLTHAFAEDYHYLESTPPKLQVLGMFVEKCHGGTQGFYLVRAIGAQGAFSEPLFKLAALEVRAYPSADEIAAAKSAHEESREKENDAATARQKARREALQNKQA